jgi:hypothetical protein
LLTAIILLVSANRHKKTASNKAVFLCLKFDSFI